MDLLLYCVAWCVVRFLQALPLPVVAQLGRCGGHLGYWLDARHRRVAFENLTQAFGSEKSPGELHALVHEHYRRLGENYAGAIKTAVMTPAALARRVEYTGTEKVLPPGHQGPLVSRMMAIGHFGNFELYGAASQYIPGYRLVTTYRALRQPRLDGLLRSLRERSGCIVLERRSGGSELKRLMTEPGMMIGLLSDQHAGDAGTWLPFFGRECSTLLAPALFAQRYRMPLHTAICYRTGLGRWRVEVGDEIPTQHAGHRRPPEEVMTEVNRAFEVAIRRDPANWFWVHRRWKPRPAKPRQPVSL